MKKTMIIILIMFVSLVSAQKKKKTNILQSTDIQEIELFLQTAHPEDPRRSVLKPKLIALKNAAWTKGAKDHKPMEARPILTIDMPENMGNSIDETEEFNKLISLSSEEHKKKTVKILNTLFDQDINATEAILMVQNNSNCKIILRIRSDKDNYDLAISPKGENSVVVNKGTYELSSKSCNLRYSTTKSIMKGTMVILNDVSNPSKEINTSK